MNSRSILTVPHFIHHFPIKFIIILSLNFFLASCQSSSADHLKDLPVGVLQISEGKELKTYVAVSAEQQMKGLSGIRPEDFSDTEAMLFTGTKDKARQFWMPNTYFDLDLFFLSEDFYVLDVHRSLKHFEKHGPEHLVPRSKIVKCRLVLEIKSGSPLANQIYPGMKLNWKGLPLEKIIPNTHPVQ